VSGSFAVTPTTSGSATYILTCSGPGGSGNASATLTVNAAAAAASSSGGGGGAIGLLDLLGLGALGLAQLRKRRHIC
jgi:Mrp family chromosome partitioning ATPase